MLFDDVYIEEVRERIASGDFDGMEFDLIDALDYIERLHAELGRS